MEQEEVQNTEEIQNKQEILNKEEINNYKIKKPVRDNNNIMNMVAIFISLISMTALIFQSYSVREENKLTRIHQSASVLPYLTSFYNNVDKKYKYVISNKGIGPAFIKDVKFYALDLKNKDTLTFKSAHKVFDFINDQINYPDSTNIVKSSFQANMLLSPNEERTIISLSFKDYEQRYSTMKEFYKYYKGFKITYEDVYGSAWVLDIRKGNYPVKLNED